MAWRIAGEPINKHLIPVQPGTSTLNGFFKSSDIGKLVQASSQQGVLLVGTSNAVTVNSIIGILAAVPADTTPLSTSQNIYVQPITRGEKLEVDYSTDTTHNATATDRLASTNVGYYLRIAGAGTSSGDNITAGFLDISTFGTTLAATTVGMFRMETFSTTRKVIWGTIDSTVLAL